MEVEQTCPPDDRAPQRRVFPGAGRQTVGNAIRNACKNAGIASYSPHDLRHRYISVKVREDVPITEISAHVGHSRKSSESPCRGMVERRHELVVLCS
jgi:integrase